MFYQIVKKKVASLLYHDIGELLPKHHAPRACFVVQLCEDSGTDHGKLMP